MKHTKIVIFLASPVLILGLLYAFIPWNQIFRPFPAPAAPVVPQLPALIARLRSSKDLGEGRAQTAIAALGQRPRFRGKSWDAKVSDGRRRYDRARAEFGGCIDYLRSGLTRRFVDSDSQEIATRLESADNLLETFIRWADTIQGAKTARSTSKGPGIVDWVSELIKFATEQNDEAVEALRADLEACRLRSWNDL